MVKLTPEQTLEVVLELIAGIKQTAIAAKWGLTPGRISQIKKKYVPPKEESNESSN